MIIHQLISKATSQSLDKVAKDTDCNYWMESEESRDYGIVRQIINHWNELQRS
ncbi:ATP-dependent Clp protease proteolytic subunit [Xenorhabdus vietnamensis]|uniref:ATP-dependent Clp protease proteolytic subunit n=1 Tax=Xenorhabdus vietnamensis TaxID=351656 RepID=UPI00142E3D00